MLFRSVDIKSCSGLIKAQKITVIEKNHGDRKKLGDNKKIGDRAMKIAFTYKNKLIKKQKAKRNTTMKKILTLKTRDFKKADGGCGECQTSCQSACKTSCGVANQPCEKIAKAKAAAKRASK